MPPTSPSSNPEHSANESHLVRREDCVAIEICENLSRLPPTMQQYPCIYRGHGGVRRQQEGDFEPHVIAIGPYHHGNPKLQKMEDQKLCYLRQFLNRSGTMSLDNYLSAMRQLEDKARQCYEEPINLDADKFAKMLLLDGCFIIEYVSNSILEPTQLRNDIDHDLILMENQLPFFVLHELSPDRDIHTLALRYVERNFSLENSQEIGNDEIDHLLGLLHYRLSSTFSRTPTQEKKESSMSLPLNVIKSATELHKAGVRFKKVDTISWHDVKFEKKVLEIPQIIVDIDWRHMYKNLIAYEQCDPEYRHGNLISDYIRFINCLIKSPRDVELLRQREIIESWARDDKTVCFLINTLTKTMVTYEQNFSYFDVFNQLNQHYAKRHHTWMAILRQRHFNTPWALVSFVVAVALLGLTISQTVFSTLSYARRD